MSIYTNYDTHTYIYIHYSVYLLVNSLIGWMFNSKSPMSIGGKCRSQLFNGYIDEVNDIMSDNSFIKLIFNIITKLTVTIKY